MYQATTGIGTHECEHNCPGISILFRASNDGGVTWGPTKFICGIACKGVGWQFDPQLQVAADGTIYAVFLNNYDPGSVLLWSKDHGETWAGPVTMNGNLTFNDKPVLVISPTGQDVYVAFNSKFDSYVAVSHDFGATFSAPVKTNAQQLWYYTYGGAIAPNGDVYFAQVGETRSHGSSLAGPQQIAIIRSTDKGVTWTTTALDTAAAPPPCAVFQCYPDYFAAEAVVAVDAAGTVMVAYTTNDSDRAPKSLYVRTSTDGIHWSSRTLVNNRGDSNFPQIARGSQAGDFRVAWQDNRNGIAAWNTFLIQTTDSGKKWQGEVRLSDARSGAPYKGPDGYTFPFGDYFGLAVDRSGTNFVIWGESDGSSIYCCGGSWYTSGR